MPQIERTGVVTFGDACLAVWEESIPSEMSFRSAWELRFKREVFARIVQTLRRLGWTVGMPPISELDVKNYGGNVARWAAERHRDCSKGDLKGELRVGGRHIEFSMWQGVNTPTRPDHGGRYEYNKEACAPYPLRLEMERTRRRIRDYLCAVFTGYTFCGKNAPRLTPVPAHEFLAQRYAEAWHFKGSAEEFAAKYAATSYNVTSADKVRLNHGQRVWFFDHKGRLLTGIAQYNINNMWWVVTGPYSVKNVAAFQLWANYPGEPRRKQNSALAVKRLRSELDKAIATASYERACLLRDVLLRDHNIDLRAQPAKAA